MTPTPDLTQKELVGIVTPSEESSATSIDMASSYDLEGGITQTIPTPLRPPLRQFKRPRWIDRYWKSNASRHALPTHQTTPTSFLHSPHKGTQLRGQVTLDTPHRPSLPRLRRNRHRGLTGSVRELPPPRVRSQRPTTPGAALLPIRPRPLMEEPRAPAQRIFIRPPTDPWPADESSDEETTAFSEPWQEDETQNASSPSPPTTRTTSTPSNSPSQTTTGMIAFSTSPPASTRRPA
ncbi:uncharacterized protein ARMOST_06101 [Armillaria ostoyae]|uniref:Uncharacterized protein n=1 Tax=Armillaria ostoyae TaxID=47428 RepID=A0A284R250_ARMOS|nr:uncharacterized protein ARMOST_06101 [Armillaria ostoyae]